MSRETYLPVLFQLFRKNGYDGVSLANISESTGLGKASLYHHFPGGKVEMLQATMRHTEMWFEKNVVGVLATEQPLRSRFEEMCDRLNTLYASGSHPCLLAAVTAGSSRDIVPEQLKARLADMVEAISKVLTDAGLDSALAHERGEDAVITIQGALILAQGIGDTTPFQRALAQLPDRLCEGL
ncbi:MAG: TetR/AcrR family transcriptional regulator [Cyanobacteria bacterium P01_D01_bin.105]